MDRNTMMQTIAREANEKGAFTGAWLLAEKGEIVSKGAVGWRDPDDTLPVREDSVFDLASVSKHFTASAVMLLRRRGLLDLEDDITKFFPDIPYAGVTIRNLLTHTSGMPDYMPWVDKLAKEENTIPGNDVVIRFLKESGAKPRFAPGEKYEYCNTGYCVLAELVEKLSGEKFEDFMRDNIFEPAGMHATRVRHPRRDGVEPENWARPMVLEDGRYVLPENSKANSFMTRLDGSSGDGYVYSSVLDLFAWDRALKAGTVLTKEEQDIMYAPGVKLPGDDEGEVGYGFGWVVFDSKKYGRVLSHSGGWPGVSTWIGRYLDADRMLVILGCRAVDEHGDASFLRAMSAVARGGEVKPVACVEDLEIKDPDKSKWESWCGKYETNPEDDSIDVVFLKDGELWAKVVTDMGYVYDTKLYPVGEKTFTFKEYDTEIEFCDGGYERDGETVGKL